MVKQMTLCAMDTIGEESSDESKESEKPLYLSTDDAEVETELGTKKGKGKKLGADSEPSEKGKNREQGKDLEQQKEVVIDSDERPTPSEDNEESSTGFEEFWQRLDKIPRIHFPRMSLDVSKESLSRDAPPRRSSLRAKSVPSCFGSILDLTDLPPHDARSATSNESCIAVPSLASVMEGARPHKVSSDDWSTDDQLVGSDVCVPRIPIPDLTPHHRSILYPKLEEPWKISVIAAAIRTDLSLLPLQSVPKQAPPPHASGKRRTSMLPFVSGAGTVPCAFHTSPFDKSSMALGIDSVVTQFPILKEVGVCLETKPLRTGRPRTSVRREERVKSAPCKTPGVLLSAQSSLFIRGQQPVPPAAPYQRQQPRRPGLASKLRPLSREDSTPSFGVSGLYVTVTPSRPVSHSPFTSSPYSPSHRQVDYLISSHPSSPAYSDVVAPSSTPVPGYSDGFDFSSSPAPDIHELVSASVSQVLSPRYQTGSFEPASNEFEMLTPSRLLTPHTRSRDTLSVSGSLSGALYLPALGPAMPTERRTSLPPIVLVPEDEVTASSRAASRLSPPRSSPRGRRLLSPSEDFKDHMHLDAAPGPGRTSPHFIPRRLRPLDSMDLQEYLHTLPRPTALAPVERQERPRVHDKLATLHGLEDKAAAKEGPDSSILCSPRPPSAAVTGVVDWMMADGVHTPTNIRVPPSATVALLSRRKAQTR